MSLFILVADIEGNQKSKLCGYDEMACKWAEEKKLLKETQSRDEWVPTFKALKHKFKNYS